MDFKLNDVYEGFKLIRIDRIEEISSNALIFEHVKTKAKLLNIQNDNSEMCFAIGFKTPPYDNSGLPHILEHSVLCGSKNFPLKDPFAILAKSSIHTFLNALTFPDKTIYPFATQNKKEFPKLMHVYLDAVFNPLIYENKNIFLQEGWRYSILNKDDKIEYSGVVYGEMKGAYSSPDSIIERQRISLLFPDTCYKYDSGGKPENIPDLTYEEFLEFHEKYYHPSNSYMYIYGDTNILEHLKFINEEYLCNYDYKEIDFVFDNQKPFLEPKEEIVKYPASIDDVIENKYFFDLGFTVGNGFDIKLRFAFEILEKILFHMPASPLKKTLLEANIGENIYGSFKKEDTLFYNIFNVTVQNTKLEMKEKFLDIFDKTLKKLVENKIDKDLIDAAVNMQEFELKEAIELFNDFPEGIKHFVDSMTTALYGGDPLLYLKYQKYIDEIKEDLKQGNFFENLIQKYLLENNHRVFLILEPSLELDYDKSASIKLEKYQEGLGEKDVEKLIEENMKLKEFQAEKESQELLDLIPSLDITKDIPKLPLKIDFEEKKMLGYKLLYHKDITKGITYINLFFDAKVIPKEKIVYLSLLCALLEEVKTKNYSFEEFSNLVNINTGDIDFNISPFTNFGTNELTPKFTIEAKALDEKLPELIHIINELLNNVIFDLAKIKEMLFRIKSNMEVTFIDSGHSVCASRLLGYIDDNSKYIEIIGSISFYEFVCDLIDTFEEKKEDILSQIKDVYNTIFNKKNLILQITTQIEDISELKKLDIKNKEVEVHNFEFEKKVLNEGFKTSSQVQYVVQGYNFRMLGYKYEGSLIVLSNFLKYDYLWNTLRMQGGAYGALCAIRQNGSFVLGSYRDPRLKETFEDYKRLPEYLKTLDIEQEEVDKYIIGAICDLDAPLRCFEKGYRIAQYYIKGFAYEDEKKERENVLGTTVNDFRKTHKMIKEILDKNCICVLGSCDKIEKNKKIFGKVRGFIK